MAVKNHCPRCKQPLGDTAGASTEIISCPHCQARLARRSGPAVTGQSQSAPQKIGRFEIRRELGAGGFGAVYEAYDPQLDRVVALKVPHPGVFNRPGLRERFLREARAAANLRHPHIVPVYESNSAGEHPYIASEFIEGRTLQDVLEEAQDGLDPRRAAQLVRELAEALAYAHSRGIVHRDVKPGNILIDARKGEAHLADFGLARREDAAETVTIDGSVLGTPSYMSPEQATGDARKIGAASDQYSAGVVLYALLCGQPPFSGGRDQVIYLVRNQEPVSPRKRNAKVPRDLETICLKAMAKEAERRYGDCQELADDLRRWQEHEPIKARRVGMGERLVRWCRRNPLVASLVVTVVVGLILGVMLFNDVNRERARAEMKAEKKTLEADRSQRSEKAFRNQTDQHFDIVSANQRAFLSRLYRAEIELAHRAVEEGEVIGALALLGNYVPRRDVINRSNVFSDRRGFEWHYILYLCRHDHFPIMEHTNGVCSVSYSPDGKRLATGSHDHTVKVWDPMTGQEVLTFKGHTRGVRSVAFSPDGSRIASGSDDGTLKVWDAQSGQEILTLQLHTGIVFSVSFSHDGKRLASGAGGMQNGGELKVWDARSGQEVTTLKGHNQLVSSVSFSSDGKRIVSGSYDGTLKLWDAQTGQETRTLKAHTNWVASVRFSPDGKRLVAGCGDGTVKVWDTQTGQEVFSIKGHTEWVSSVGFSHDGKHLVSGSRDRTVKMWDAQTGQETLTLKGHTDGIDSVSFSPDGKRIVSGSSDHSVRVWIAKPRQNTTFPKGHSVRVNSVAFSPDGKRIVSGSADGLVKVWDAQSRIESFSLKGHTKSVSNVAFSPDGKRIVSGSGDRTVKLWDAETGQETLTLKGHTGAVTSVGFSPDGQRIVSGSEDRVVKVWYTGTGREVLSFPGYRGEVLGVAFSPDGKWIVSQGYDVTDARRGHNPDTGEKNESGQTSVVRNVAYSPDGKQIVSGGWHSTVKVWDAQTGEALRSLNRHPFAWGTDPNGLPIWNKDSRNWIARVWDASTGQEIHALIGDTRSVNCAAFSPDGKRIVSGGGDQTVKVWDTETGLELFSLKGHMSEVLTVAFSPDGKRIISGSIDGALKVWGESHP